jgi:predicted nucleic acid-binding Zn ribbon protein
MLLKEYMQKITQAIRSDDIAEVLEDAERAARNLMVQIFSLIQLMIFFEILQVGENYCWCRSGTNA